MIEAETPDKTSIDSTIRHKTEATPYLNALEVNYTDCSLGSEWVNTAYSKEDGKYLVEPASIDSVRVPNVKGMNVTDAVYLLENRGWNIAFEGQGRVIQQSVKPGDTLQPGSLITLTLARP